jgi:hypothetical protein
MRRSDLLTLSKDELVDLLEAYSKLYSALDGLWFLSVEKEYGHDAAVELDVEVWNALLPKEANRICKAKHIENKGVDAVLEAFTFRPTFLSKEFDVVKEKKGAVVRVTKCRSLHAMERDNREVSSCLRILEKIYPTFVYNVDENVKFRVLKAPPRRSENDTCCEWSIEEL